MNTDNLGFLTVRTFTAGGALPVEGSNVFIKGAEESNTAVRLSLLTDRSGMTEKVSLPAPAKSISLFPGGGEESYSSYDVEITKEGFYTKTIKNLPIFPGISATLPVNMLPLSLYDAESSLVTNEKNTVIQENEFL